MIYVEPDCCNDELQNEFVPGSLIQGIFSDASLLINANHAKQIRIIGSAFYKAKIYSNFFNLQPLCDIPQNHDHLESEIFIDYTTLPLKNTHLHIVSGAPADHL
jgi:hypothetical protein